MRSVHAIALLLLAAAATLVAVVGTGERCVGGARSREPSPVHAPKRSADLSLLEPSDDESAAVGSDDSRTAVLVSHSSSPSVAPPTGTLAGRWVDPQGEPIRLGRFQLVPEDPSRKPGYAARAKGYFAGGRTSAAVTTDLDGRFRVEGLCRVDYLATEGLEHGWARIAGPFSTDRAALLVTAPYRIEVKLLDADGRPLRPEAFEESLESAVFRSPTGGVVVRNSLSTRPILGRRLSDGSVVFDAEPARTLEESLENAVFCSPIDGAAVRDSRSTSPIPGRRLSDGTVVFEVEPARTYRVGYDSPSDPTQPREVFVARERCCTRVEIRLPSPGPSSPSSTLATDEKP